MKINQVLPFFKERRGCVIGQHLAYHLQEAPTGYQKYVKELHTLTGQYPGMIGVDFGTGDHEDFEAVVQLLIAWHNAGGLVTIDYIPGNFWTGEDAWSLDRGPLEDLTDPNTGVGAIYAAELAFIRTQFEILRAAGVPILFRPFPEMTWNGSFWWDCAEYWNEGYSPQPFVDLWRYTHDMLDMDNVYWVYAAANTHPWTPVTTCYPGDAYVDIVGVDVYSNVPEIKGDGYQALLALGKPFAFCEVGPETMDGSQSAYDIMEYIRKYYQDTIYAQWWHEWKEDGVEYNAALVSNQGANLVMGKDWILTRADLQEDEVSIVDKIEVSVSSLEERMREMQTAMAAMEEQIAALRAITENLRSIDEQLERVAKEL